MQKHEFLLTGAVETALIYFRQALIAGSEVVEDLGLGICVNGVGRFYIGKRGMTQMKDALLARPLDQLVEEYDGFLGKWSARDAELFSIATEEGRQWHSDWKQLDRLMYDLLYESYKVEALDSWADEIEKEIAAHLSEKKIDGIHLHALIAPTEPTLIQREFSDLEAVRAGRMSAEAFMRRYWYVQGTWNGGVPLDAAALERRLAEVHPAPDFEAIKRVHAQAEPLLDSRMRELVRKLRLLTLWREERKAQMQRIGIGYTGVSREAARQHDIDERLARWATAEEAEALKTMVEVLSHRAGKKVLVVDGISKSSEIRMHDAAQQLIDEFDRVDERTELKGTVASRGRATGEASIVLRESDFPNFKEGQVLITTMTRPEFVPLMRKAAAVVTDEGGLTCHAAIISRELGIPCIVGTREATRVFTAGATVEVDANAGIVRVVEE